MRGRWACRLVLAAGAAYALYLQSLLPGEVFLVGDGGLKALLVHQYAAGDFHADLRLPAPRWAQTLWDDGLFPFQEPYVYWLDGRRFVRFPFPFPLITAPFYRALGFRGLQLLPVLSVFLTWLAFLRFGRGLRLSPWARATGLALLIFCSPLTFYSATFWEHTPSVLLAFLGIGLVLARPFGQVPRPSLAVVGGALVGLAGWLREEQLLLGACVTLVLVARRRTSAGRSWSSAGQAPAIGFVAGLFLALLPFLALNAATYGHPLGVHHLHAAETLRQSDLGGALRSLRSSLTDLLIYFPIAAACPVLLFLPSRWPGTRSSRRLFLAATFFVILFPLLIQVRGKDFGPRLLLAAVPVLALAAAVLVERIRRPSSRPFRWAAVLVVITSAGLGFATDTLRGTVQLRELYARRYVPLRALLADPAHVIAVSHEFVAQQLAGAFPERLFFHVAGASDLKRLARAVAEQGERRFLYVCHPAYPCAPLGEGVRQLVYDDAAGHPWLALHDAGVYDRYLFYDARVQKPAEGD